MPMMQTSPVILALVAVAAYLLGSVPFGIVITRVLGLGDLRKIGSGNIGATNVLRTGHKGAALATLLLDAGKGGAAVALARLVGGADAAVLAALASFLGHLFPVWLGFAGGKGVATYLGTLLVLDWRLGLAACATWAVTAVVTRISSLSALVAVALTNLWVWLLGDSAMLGLSVVLSVLIYWKHWPNLQRIAARSEPKIGAKK